TVKQEFKFSREVFTDTVTHEITFGNWNFDSSSFESVVFPSLKGYTPDIESVEALIISPDSKDTDITVTYTKNPIKTSTEDRVVKRTIHYVVEDNSVKAPDPVSQEFTFSREVFTDTVTHEITFGNWNFDHSSFDAVVSPALKGYTPDIESVDALTVTPDSKDIDVTVTYTKNPIKTSTEDKVVKRTIIYVVKDNGVKAPGTVKQEFKFSREVFTDTVTREITFGNWNLDHSSFDAVVSPALKGYTPDIESVDALTISPDSKDTDVAVTYTKTSTEDRVVKRTINYVVEDNNVKAPETVNQVFTFSREVFTDTVTHETTFGNWNFDHSSFDAVVSPALKGYTPDVKSVDALTISPDSKDTDVTVTYTKNPVETSTEDRVVKRTIHYVVEDNSVKAPEAVNQQFTFSREVFTDAVTGEITFGNWNFNHSSFESVVSPSLKGYTPDIKTVDTLTITPSDEDSTVTVTYTKNPVEVQPTPKPAEPVDSNKPSPTEPTNIVTKQVNPTSVTAKSQTPNQVVPSQQATTSKELPQTGEDHSSLTTIGLLMLSLATGLGLKKRKKD
ncbi:LPXTG cell wall anchor domain-containing protein, partial [Ligilactobacillus salivarius]|uniref:mucin-binding protein n=1 Tax=Ligilactobacillus salivarius TaxID=1624 RepID=UPI000E43D226